MNKIVFMDVETGKEVLEIDEITKLDIDSLNDYKNMESRFPTKECTFSCNSTTTLTQLAFLELKTQSNINEIYSKEIIEKVVYDKQITEKSSDGNLNKVYSGHDGTLLFTIMHYSEIISFLYKFATDKRVSKIFFGEIENDQIYLNGYMKDNLTIYFKIKLKKGSSADYSVSF